MNNDAREKYNIISKKNKTAISNSSLCDHSDVYILVKGTVINTGAQRDVAARQRDQRSEQIAFKNFAPFSDCINKIKQ